MTTLVTHIKQLVGVRQYAPILHGTELSNLPSINDAFLLVEDGVIAAYGPMTQMAGTIQKLPRHIIEATGQFVLPCWCDSHTHIVFSGSRENEFVDKINGLNYAEIAARGGGILNSARQIEAIGEDELFNESWERLQAVAKMGTGAIEIKSGYGLSLAGELKMLRVIRRLQQKSALTIRSTFLGAHTYPRAYINDHQGYIDLLLNELLPIIAAEKLADYIDVFCESGFFSAEETALICGAGKAYGLKPKLHVNQLNSIGGIAVGQQYGAISLDHLETLTEEDIRLLASPGWGGLCTLLPAAAFFLRMGFQPARKLIDAGCAIALATDYNPGSAPSGNMNFVVALSCIQMKMTPEEAINAATINGAHAMECSDQLGTITVGKKANLIFTRPVPSLAYLPYSFGSNLVEKVMINGEFL